MAMTIVERVEIAEEKKPEVKGTERVNCLIKAGIPLIVLVMNLMLIAQQCISFTAVSIQKLAIETAKNRIHVIAKIAD